MAKKEITFEQALARLQQILDTLSAGQATLDESIALYAEAAQLVQQCNQRLADAKIQVEEIGNQLTGGEGEA